jgi:hypothetical protein
MHRPLHRGQTDLRRGVDNPATGASVHAKLIYASRPASLILFSKCFDCFLLWLDPKSRSCRSSGVQELQNEEMPHPRGNHDDRNNILALYSATPEAPATPATSGLSNIAATLPLWLDKLLNPELVPESWNGPWM